MYIYLCIKNAIDLCVNYGLFVTGYLNIFWITWCSSGHMVFFIILFEFLFHGLVIFLLLIFSNQGLRKLSYAEVCQRLAQDKPPAQMPSPSPPASSAGQPLQELKVNRGEEPCPNNRRTTDKPEKNGESRPPRQPLRSFRGVNGQARAGGAGLKLREHQRGLNTGKPFTPQRGARRSGKEQNIPPRSPK